MPVTADAFNQHNTVLFRTRILHDHGWTVTLPGQKYQLGDAFVIDMNHNNQADWQQLPAPPGRTRMVFTEPTLVQNYDTIKAAAVSRGTILTQNEVAGLMIQDLGVDFGDTNVQEDRLMTQNMRPLSALAYQLVPRPDVACGLDLNSDEFIVYSPKST